MGPCGVGTALHIKPASRLSPFLRGRVTLAESTTPLSPWYRGRAATEGRARQGEASKEGGRGSLATTFCAKPVAPTRGSNRVWLSFYLTSGYEQKNKDRNPGDRFKQLPGKILPDKFCQPWYRGQPFIA